MKVIVVIDLELPKSSLEEVTDDVYAAMKYYGYASYIREVKALEVQSADPVS
jgi:hypothetical protein